MCSFGRRTSASRCELSVSMQTMTETEMRPRHACVLLALIALFVGNNTAPGQDDDPVIEGSKLSELVKAFRDAKTADERSSLALVIARGRDKAASAVPLLAAALKDNDRIVRVNIATALGTMGPAAKAAVPDLIAALKDTDAS